MPRVSNIDSIQIDRIAFGGWPDNLRIASEHAEVIVTLDVGPRVISYRTRDGENVFKTFADQLGGSGETEWKARGGHRFWLAPEDPVLSYIPDNSRVEYNAIGAGAVEFVTAATDQLPVQKTLRVTLDSDSSSVTVEHRAENCGNGPRSLATWGLSVMNPGGIEIIPLPPPGEHPRDLLPNRALILWPYTDMSDPRWRWGRRFITLRQADTAPTKIGLAHRENWAAYHNNGTLFVKTFAFDEAADYPDGGCNFETFTNGEMLEVEALGPLVSLEPGESTGHTERWHLLPNTGAPENWDDAAISEWISPLLARVGIP